MKDEPVFKRKYTLTDYLSMFVYTLMLMIFTCGLAVIFLRFIEWVLAK
jgi:hypothetical protein